MYWYFQLICELKNFLSWKLQEELSLYKRGTLLEAARPPYSTFLNNLIFPMENLVENYW